MLDQRRALARLYKQWKRGLLCCLAPALRRRLDPETAPFVIEALDAGTLKVYQEFDHEQSRLGNIRLESPSPASEPLKTLKGGGKSLTLRLSGEGVLRKKARFPAAAAENLYQVVGFEMDRLTPFSSAQVYYDCRIAEQSADSGEVLVDLAIAPRARLEPLLSSLRKIGLRVTAIDASGFWDEMNLLPEAERPGRSRLGIAGTLSLWLIVLTLIAAVLITPLWHKRSIAIELEQRAARSKNQAMAVTGLRGKVDQGLELLNRVPARRNELRPAVEVIRDLTDMLPDDTWVQQFELKGGKLELRGLSRQATSLIQRLEENPGFAGVGFRSPVLQAGGEERFHLSAKLSTSGEKIDPPTDEPGADQPMAANPPTDDLMVSGG